MRWYEWDSEKAASNLRKHGVAFEDAIAVFEDPHALITQDRIEAREQRWQTIGLANGLAVLMVCHTEDEDDGDELVRVISARRATPRERNRYENAVRENTRG